jgi:non-heme chloroperoxidase
MAYLQTGDGTTLFYNDWGSGPPVVLIHAWPLNSDMWEYQAPALVGAGSRVIAYDRRGFGRSSQPWTGYDYDTLADDLHALMDHLSLSGSTLVGFSMGGGEAVRLLTRHGADRVARLALISAVTPYLLKAADNPDGVDRGVFDQMAAALAADRPSFLAGFGRKFFGAGMLNFSVSSEILQWAQMMAMQAFPKATIDCLRAFSETDFRPEMRNLAVPTLIVHGTSDATVPIGVSATPASRLVPEATCVEYDGAPHGLFYTERNRLNADLLAFIRG